MVPLFLHTLSASAAGDGSQWPIPADAFSIERGEARLRVTEIGLPKSVGIDPKFRICRVSVGWTGGKWAPALRSGCHPNLVDLVNEAAERWVIDVSSPPRGDRELFEYWYVFPVTKGDPVRVFVRQAWDQQLVLDVPELDVLDWSIKGRIFPEYPEAAASVADTVSTECDVKIDIAASGVPGEIVITGCDEVFRPELLENLQSWRWGGPELDGVPFPSGVTVGVKFTKNLDGGEALGRVDMTFPPDAQMGARTRTRAAPVEVEPEPPPLPTWPALFRVDHRSFAEVGVYDVKWPAPSALDEEVTCDVLFQVNSARRVWAWTEGCDERVRAPVEAAASKWSLMHGKIGEGERFARFRGTFVFPAGGGHALLRIPAEDLVSSPRALPENVETYVIAKAIKSVPPRLPRSFATEVTDLQVRCEYDVRVDTRGRPSEIASRSCPGGYGTYAERAISQWRWTPAAANGKPIDSRVTVRIRFEQPEGTPVPEDASG
jgi:hypothetical protein